MSRFALPDVQFGNEFAHLQPKVKELLQRSTIVTFAVLFLLVGIAGITVGGNYYSAQAVQANAPALTTLQFSKSSQISGLNQSVNSNELESKLQTITSQPATLTVGEQTAAISPATIRSWLTITHDQKKSVDYIHINAATVTKSLNEAAAKYVKAPVNQVTATHPDGSSAVIVAGRNGTQLTTPDELTKQAQLAAKTVMDGKGLKFSTGLAPLAFQSVTPAAFGKLIEVNVNTKQMYLYDNGQITHTYAISAGAPVTPTPIGQFKIYAKYATQDMKGLNADGTKYLQPHVHWINYFLPGGYAVHGNYWRPASVFGAVNTSHGCVSLPDYQAKQVYDWAPIGTTVITHY